MSLVGCILVFAVQAHAIDALKDFKINDKAVGKASLYQISIRDGVSNRQVKGRISKVKTSGTQTEVKWQSYDGKLRATICVSKRNQSQTYRLTVYTSKRGMRLLRVSLAVPVSDVSRFWDGYEERRWKDVNALERTQPQYTFPLACAYGDKQGMAVGITPDSIVSSLRPGIRRIAKRSELFYETRLVVDAKNPQKVTFVSYPFQQNFGYLDAVQDYYGLFPKAFHPKEGLDSRIYGVGGHIRSSYRTGRLALNSARRGNTNWEWSYTPWVRSGDWYPEKADWVEGTDVIGQYENYRDKKKGTWEEYHDARVKQFANGNKTSAMFYYILIKDINVEFLKRYPGSSLVYKTGKTHVGGMGAIPGEKTSYCSPYGSGLSDWLEDEVRKVVKNYEISGFAFDMTNHRIDDYGSGQLKCGVGRTFDDDGQIYSPDTISSILMADAVHKLSRGGKRMGVIANQALNMNSCFPVFHADGVMHEGLPYWCPENAAILRLMSGRKPMTFWGGVGFRRISFIRWSRIQDQKTIVDIRAGLAKHALFTCLRLGVTPMDEAADSRGMGAWLPTLLKIKRLGWNPVPAVISSSPKLWIGRFGDGTQTIITITNPKRQRIKADLTVLNKYLGSQAYVFVKKDGQVLSQNITREKTTFSVDMKPKEIMVLRTVALDVPGRDAFPGITATSKRIPELGKVELNITSPGNQSLTATVRADSYPGKKLTKLNDSNGSASFVIDKGCFQITLPAKRESRLNLIYEDTTRLAANKKDILACFSEEDALSKPTPVVIVLPDKASPEDQVAAEMVESYYANLQAYRESLPNFIPDFVPGFMDKKWDTAVRIPIVPLSKLKQESRKRIYIGTTKEFPKLAAMLNEKAKQGLRSLNGGFIEVISADNRPALWIGGKQAGEIETAIGIYLKLLDSKYITAGQVKKKAS